MNRRRFRLECDADDTNARLFQKLESYFESIEEDLTEGDDQFAELRPVVRLTVEALPPLPGEEEGKS